MVSLVSSNYKYTLTDTTNLSLTGPALELHVSRRMVKTGSVHVAAKNLEYNRHMQPLCGQNNMSKRCVRNARCQTGLNFGERSKFAVATFLSLKYGI